ncbi:hypothetical protein DRB06_07905 [Actinomyces sp. Z5]|nr:hypothetical protein DRB06_07905 [Actinomyces sp. Z5]RAX24601.1 hypothetical protein DRB07_00735 [Actinomyces sp. Z3]
MVCGIVGIIFACIPGALVIGWILLPIAFILGLVALFRRGERLWPSVTAIIVAVVGGVVSPMVFLGAATEAVDDALGGSESTFSAAPDVQAAPEEDDAAADAQTGTREQPLPLGSKVSGAEWKVVVNSVTFDATDAVLAENEFNEAPADGYEYILINYSITYLGNDPNGEYPDSASVAYVTPDGVTIDGFDTMAVTPDDIDTGTALYNGGSVSGNVALSVPSATAQDGVLAVQPGMIADKVFVAVE